MRNFKLWKRTLTLTFFKYKILNYYHLLRYLRINRFQISFKTLNIASRIDYRILENNILYLYFSYISINFYIFKGLKYFQNLTNYRRHKFIQIYSYFSILFFTLNCCMSYSLKKINHKLTFEHFNNIST